MKLYHTTKTENASAIEFDGLVPSGETRSVYGYDRECEAKGVYGFTSIEDARNFAMDNGWYGYAIFAFETDDQLETIADPEYDDGAAYIVIPAYSTIKAEAVEIIED